MSIPRLFVFVTLGSATGCGASYQRVYEGDVRFEHCYRLDADPGISASTREMCWSDWLASHTTGQTFDRVDYARRRQTALHHGESVVAGPSLVTGQPRPTRQTYALNAAVVPTAPPRDPAAPGASSSARLSSRQQCAQECGQTFTTCVTRCENEACGQKCGNQVKACLDTCL